MADLVGAKTELRRSGQQLMGCCPFHDERTPSFSVDPDRKVFHCFGCGEGGDLFKFVELTEGLRFREAVEHLADRYGVQLELTEEDPRAAERRKERDRLLELLERTASWYVRLLWESDEAADSRRYLLDRGLDEQQLREFRVGYAPSAWDGVLAGLAAQRLLGARALRRGPRAPRQERPALRLLPPADHVPALRRARAGARLRRPRGRRRPAAEVRQLDGQRRLPQGPPPLRRPTSRVRRPRRPARWCSARATRTSSRCTRRACATPSG